MMRESLSCQRRSKVRVGKINLRVLNRDLISHYEEDTPHVVISIRDVGSKVPTFSNTITRIDELLIECTDWDDPEMDGLDDGRGGKYRLFQPEDAQRILDFVTTYLSRDINTFYVHCEAGISRSAAVAAALAAIEERHGDDFFFKMFLPNRLVYRTILTEWISRLS
jgi:predicted protein tyrosine phosphatase